MIVAVLFFSVILHQVEGLHFIPTSRRYERQNFFTGNSKFSSKKHMTIETVAAAGTNLHSTVPFALSLGAGSMAGAIGVGKPIYWYYCLIFRTIK